MKSGERIFFERLQPLQLIGSARPSVPVPSEPTTSPSGGGELQNSDGAESKSTSPNKAVDIAAPIQAKIQGNDFKTLLNEYSRSIIKSAMDHVPEEAVSLKNDIIAAKLKVLAKYATVENDLEIAESENTILKANVDELLVARAVASEGSRLQRIANRDLDVELRRQREIRDQGVVLLEQETEKRKGLETEMEELKRDKKRKRDSVAAIWEEAESIKLN